MDPARSPQRNYVVEASDDALMAGMALGDEDAALAFVRRYQRRVYGLAFSVVRDEALADDIAQETFLRAWKHASVFDRRRGAVSTWLLTIARNLAVDALRLRRASPVAPGDALWLSLATHEREPGEEAARSDTRTRLMAALASLPAEQKRALVLATMYGYTAAEVGEVEGVPVGTAKSRIRRGLERLRESVPAGGPGEQA
jgi:RNA polymerase sigma factor (sigma-70 family)